MFHTKIKRGESHQEKAFQAGNIIKKTIRKKCERFIQKFKKGESHQERSGHLLLPYSAKKRPRR